MELGGEFGGSRPGSAPVVADSGGGRAGSARTAGWDQETARPARLPGRLGSPDAGTEGSGSRAALRRAGTTRAAGAPRCRVGGEGASSGRGEEQGN